MTRAILVLLCLGLLPVVAAAQSWVAERVDSSNTNGECTLVATDRGSTYLVYTRGPGHVLRCACDEDHTWSIVTLDSNGKQWPSKPRQNASGLPELAYTRVSLRDDTWQLRVAQLSDSGWVTAIVDSGPWYDDVIVTPSPRPSYSVAGTGTRAVAYGCATSDSTWDVRVARMVADTWQRETVWSGARTGDWLWVPQPFLSLVPGDSERVWFSLYDPAPVDTGYLFLASRTDSGWAQDTIDRISRAGFDLYASEADSKGRHHLVYTSNWGLCYRTGIQDSWTVEVVRAPFGRGEEGADMVMSEGTPYIASSATMDALLCSYYVPPVWVHESIPSAAGLGPCITQESDGTLVARYWVSLDLLYARRLADDVTEVGSAVPLQATLLVGQNPVRTRLNIAYA